jgi:hypothetical protein
LQILGLFKDEYKYLSDLMKLSHEAAIVQAYKIVEAKIMMFLSPYLSLLKGRPDPLFWERGVFSEFLLDLEQNKYLSDGILERFVQLRTARNTAAHVEVAEDSSIDWQQAFETAEELILALEKAKEEGYSFMPRKNGGEVDKGANS